MAEARTSAGARPGGRGAGTARPTVAELLARYGCGPLKFAGDPNASFERHLIFDHVVSPAAANTRERYEAVARATPRLPAPGAGSGPRRPTTARIPSRSITCRWSSSSAGR